MGELVSIVYKPEGSVSPADGYARVPLQEATLVAGYGIEGDAKGGGDTRHLNVMSAENLQSLASEGFRTAPGQLGEQLVVGGLIVESLPVGACLQIGESARIEIVEPRKGCIRFEGYQNKVKEQAAGRLGVIARVVEGGVIRPGDAVKPVG